MGVSCAQAGAAANRAASRAKGTMRCRIMGLVGCGALSLGPDLALLSSNIFVMVAISLRPVHPGRRTDFGGNFAEFDDPESPRPRRECAVGQAASHRRGQCRLR